MMVVLTHTRKGLDNQKSKNYPHEQKLETLEYEGEIDADDSDTSTEATLEQYWEVNIRLIMTAKKTLLRISEKEKQKEVLSNTKQIMSLGVATQNIVSLSPRKVCLQKMLDLDV